MDPDQSVESQAAQACMPPPVVSTMPPSDAAPPTAAAPGPAESPAQASNPVLAPVEHEAKEGGEGGEGGEKKEDEHEGAKEAVTTGTGLVHAANDVREGVEATHEAIETAEDLKKIGELDTSVNAIPLSAAQEAAAAGNPNLMQTVKEAQTAARMSGEAGKLTAGNVIAPLALAADGYELYEAGKDISEKGADLNNVPKAVQAGLGVTSAGIGTLGTMGTLATMAGAGEAGAAMTGAAAAAAPVAMVAGAGAGGMAVGGLMAKAADSDYAKGWGADGKMTAMDYGASAGTWVDSHIGDKDPSHPSVLGGAAAAAGGIGMGAVGAVQAGGNWLAKHLWGDSSDAAGSGGGGAGGAPGA